MERPEIVTVALDIARILRALGIPHVLTGSFASSVHGVPRMTRDVDFVAEVDGEQVARLATALGDAYYADIEAMRDAVRRGTMFNLAHLGTLVKVDIHVPHATPFRRAQFERRVARAIGPGGDASLDVLSAEDIVLQKLRWFDAGGRVSDQQWRDVLGVLQGQAGRLDEAYLDSWAAQLAITDLLERARAQALLL